MTAKQFVKGLIRLDLQKQLKRLVKIHDDSFKPHAPRYHERDYLRAVYELYRKWRDENKSNARAKQLAEMCKKKLRSDTHPIRVIVDCSAPGANEKMKSKWTQALRFAYEKHVLASDLSGFMGEHGGMAGCASGFAKLKRSKKPQPAPKAPKKKPQAPPKKKQQVIGSKKTRQSSGSHGIQLRNSSEGRWVATSEENQQGIASTENDDKTSW